jgi:hypothetical protein
MQSVPITTKFVSSNPAHDENLQQVSGLFRVLWFSPPIKLTTIIDEVLVLLPRPKEGNLQILCNVFFYC